MSASTFRAVRLMAVLVVAGCVGSCGDSPTAPSRQTVTGTWVSSDRSFTWTLAQSGTTVTGTHVPTDGQPAVAINGVFSGTEFSFRVITGERVVTFLLDGPEIVEVGWSARVDVNGDRMTGSISSIGSPFRYSFHEITMRRVDTSR
jgi:hypothetical protein